MSKKSELQELENMLNEDWLMENEGYTFRILKDIAKEEGGEAVDVITLKIFGDDKLLHTYSTLQIFDTLEENIMSLIGAIYAKDINDRKKFIKNYKGAFLARKVRSISIAMEKGNTEKVQVINAEIVENYHQAQQYQQELLEYKPFVCLMYRVRDRIIKQSE
ncbi:MAG: hypothetical protein EOM34_16835 [Clostridia bacterium]|nr:hypothetical protein [Clostridia bacterium]